MGGLHVGLDLQRLDPGRVLQNQSELGLVRLQLRFGQIEASQARYMGDVDLYGHRGGVYESPPSHQNRKNGPVAEANPMRSTAIALGVVGLLVILVGVVLVQDPDDGSTLGGLIIRVGAVLGALALVLPTIRKPSLPTLIVAGVGLVLVLARPGLIWAALIGWAVWVLLGRQRRMSSSDS
jgi:hypothetical protein